MEQETLKKWVTDLTLELIQQKTVNYDPKLFPSRGPDEMKSPGEETKVVKILEREFLSRGVKYEIHAKVPPRAMIIARVGRGSEGYRKLMVLLHTDTVPAGNRELWDFDPFKGFERDGKIYGRGAGDNKGPLASSMAALMMLKEREKDIEGEFILAAVPDEEVGLGYGIEYLFLQDLVTCTDAIIPDIGGSMKRIDIAEKGRVLLKIEVEGKQAHASKPEKGVNAIFALARILGEIESLNLEYTPHKFLEKPTVSLGLISGGSAPNTVAGDASATFDIRTVPGQKVESIVSAFEKAAAGVLPAGCKQNIKIMSTWGPTTIPADAPIVKKIQKYAPEAKVIGIGGGTFCKPLIEKKGVHAVGFAPGSGDTFHMANEFVEQSQLVDYAYLLRDIAFDLVNERI